MIAVLGATGYIGRSLAHALARDGRAVHLFARRPEKLRKDAWPSHVVCRALAEFQAGEFGLVINAIGAGDPTRVAEIGSGILDITHEWDQRVLASLRQGKTRYVFLSSGIVYGQFGSAARADSVLTLPVNRLEHVSPYLISKLYAEARHRFLPDQAILDVRVFGYADAAIDVRGSFFLAQLAKSIVSGNPFVTSQNDMIRDYAGARELCQLIDCWECAGAPNLAADLYTRGAVSKSLLLQHAVTRYGVEVKYLEDAKENSVVAKPLYGSLNAAAAEWGYIPQRDALQVVIDTLDEIKPGR